MPHVRLYLDLPPQLVLNPVLKVHNSTMQARATYLYQLLLVKNFQSEYEPRTPLSGHVNSPKLTAPQAFTDVYVEQLRNSYAT